MSSEDKQIDPRSIWSKHTSANGDVYYYNVQTNQSQWQKPDCFLDEESEVAPEWQQYVTEDGKEYWYNTVTRESKWQNPDLEISSDEEDEVPPDPYVQFTQLLKENKIMITMKWDQVVKQLANDSRWKCIGSISEKKKIFNKFVQDLKNSEKDENKSKLNYAKEDFIKMLEEHKINTSDIKLWKVQSYLITDQRWKAIPEEKERENLFQDYLDRLYEQERDQQRINRKTSTEEFRQKLERYLEVGVVTHSSKWEEVLKLFSQDRLMQNMCPVDALGVFEEFINPLYESWRQSIIAKYRNNRIKFRELLQEQVAEGVLTHKTKWQTFVPSIQQDQRFLNVLGQQGSQPHELFSDFAANLKSNHKQYKAELKAFLIQKNLKSLAGISFEEVDQMLIGNPVWNKMQPFEKKYYYRYFQESVPALDEVEQKKKKKKKDKKDKDNKKKSVEKQDIAQFEPEKKLAKLEQEPEDGEIPPLPIEEVEPDKGSSKKNKKHHKSKKHHK